MTPLILPVIHYADHELARFNAREAFRAGCDGVLLIYMGGTGASNRHLAPAAMDIKAEFPDKLVGINYLGTQPVDALLRNLSCDLDMTWTDHQLSHSSEAPSYARATEVCKVLRSAPDHLLFSGVAFKHQDHEPNPGEAARTALSLGFVPTTSGPATGVPAEVDNIRRLREAIGPDAPLAIASGITPDNVAQFAPYLSHILVATGVSSSFHTLDYDKMAQLCAVVKQCNA